MTKGKLVVALCILLAVALTACRPSAPPTLAVEPAATAVAPPTEATSTATPEPAPTATPAQEATATPVPTEAGSGADPCLVGTWEVGDMSAYVASVLPIEMLLGGELQFKGTTGRMRYTFGDDGRATLKADAYTFIFEVTVSEVGALAVTITLDGTSTGSYAADGDFLTLSAGATAELEVTAAVAGEVTGGNTEVANLMPLGAPGEQVYPYHCEGNTVQVLSPVTTALPFTLKRVGP